MRIFVSKEINISDALKAVIKGFAVYDGQDVYVPAVAVKKKLTEPELVGEVELLMRQHGGNFIFYFWS